MTFAFVTIIVPVYNGERMISECIESLLNQDYPKDKYEIIIVDNNSKDRTAEAIRRYPVRYALENKVQSSYAARNRGVEHSKGEIIAFTDADCVASIDWLKKGIEGFRDANAGCVAGEVKGYRPTNFVEEYLANKHKLSQTVTLSEFFLPYTQTANAFYRKIIFEKIGFFENKWVSSGDADFAWRMQLETNYKIKFLPEATVFHKHRSTLNSMFKQCIKWGAGYTSLYKKYPSKMQRRTLKEVIWVFLRLFYISGQSLIFCFRNKYKMPQEKRERYLDLISFMGWEVGRIIGSIKNRVFCV